jgi:3'-5' exonuclease
MQELFVRTDKKLIPTLPRYTFEGRIIVIQSENEANRAVAFLRTQKIVGIDTETRPSFRRGQQHKVALIQIATPDICFLFRLNYMGFPDSLIKLLEDTQIAKVGLSLKDDIHQLEQRHTGFNPQNFIDLQQIATRMGIEDMSLAKLFANFFRQRISKNAQLSNWEADALDEKQRVYAATDASACLLLYSRMQELVSNKQYQLISVP